MLKNILPVKSTVLLINHIDEVISGYHIVVIQLHYRLSKTISKNAVRINICAKSFEENMLIVASLRYCVHQQACNLYH